MTTTPPKPCHDRRLTAPWVRMIPDRGTHGTPTGKWAAVLMDGRKGVSGAVDACPWQAAAVVVGFARGRGMR